jgi:hypothetical protein
MKKLITLTIILLQLGFTSAQNNYIAKIWGNPSKDEKVSDIFVVNHNTFFASVLRDYNIGNTPAECIILKLDSNLNLIDSFKLNTYNKKGFKYWVSNFFYYNNQIIAFGNAFDSVSLMTQIWFSKFDDDLTIIYDTIIENSNATANLFNYKILITSQNKLLITNQYVPAIHDSTNTMVWLLDSVFNIIKENEFHTKVGFEGFSVVELPSIQSFHIITQNEITKINSNDLSYDTIVWKVEDEYTQWMSVGGALAINDSIYIQTRLFPFYNFTNYKHGYNIFIYNRNKNGVIKDSILIGNQQESFYKTSTKNIDFFTKDSIFVTGMNFSLDSNFASNEDNTIFLWNISFNGQINWQKYYTAAGLKVLVNDITKTSDGGCILVGKIWDWQINPFFNSDIFFLKLDRNGNIVGSQGINAAITQNEILVYPNPAKDYLNFDMGLYRDFQLSVYNQLGQILLQKNFTTGNITINIRDFTTGIYFYKLLTKNGKVISGKFVKE